MSHYTDWGIGHVHSGALGWVAFVSFGALYYLVPVLWHRKQLYSMRLVSSISGSRPSGSCFTSPRCGFRGIMQGLMWRAYDNLGFLQYSFVESVSAMHPYSHHPGHRRRPVVVGGVIMAYNFYRTIKGDVRSEAPYEAPVAATARG